VYYVREKKGGLIDLGNCGLIAGAFSSTSGKADSVLTTKGDLATYSTTRIREAVGTNYQTLMADSSEATGIKWAASSTSVLTTAGDLLVASGANALTRLARGSDNYVLTMNGTSLNWEAAATGASLSGDNTWTGTNTFQDDVSFEAFSAQSLTTLTISAAKITMTTNLASVDTEASASSDDLNEALGVATSAIISLRAYDASRTVVVKDNVGSVQFLGAGDFSLDNSQDTISYIKFDGTHNYEIARSSNGT